MTFDYFPLCSLVLFSFATSVTKAQFEDPSVFYTMMELACSNGYPAQEHKITTEDGYILTIYRIPNARRRPKIPPKMKHYQKLHTGYHPDFSRCVNESLYEKPTGPPILLAHGLLSSSDNFVLQGPGSDLAYMLVDAGYDVWFSNIRGNFYSRKHIRMTPSNPKFWDFSFHEMGVYDVPAIIGHILQTTGHDRLSYIGHSMGTTMFFVMTSTKPEYNNKIKLFVGLTPVSEIKRENFSPAKAQAFTSGYNLVKKLTMYLSHGLSGSSTKTIDHYQQFFDNPFAYFDYGLEENLQRYGQEKPPKYNYSNIVAPVALFYSKGDYIVSPKDVNILLDNLPNVVEAHLLSKYSHVDYLWAYNAKDLVYKRILFLIQKFDNREANNLLNESQKLLPNERL